MLTSALIAHTRRIELMCAVHPGIVPPQLAAQDGGLARPHQRRAVRGQRSSTAGTRKSSTSSGNGGLARPVGRPLPPDGGVRRRDEGARGPRRLSPWRASSTAASRGRLPIRPVQLPNPPIYGSQPLRGGQGGGGAGLRRVVRRLRSGLCQRRRQPGQLRPRHRRARPAGRGVRPVAVLRHQRACHLHRERAGEAEERVRELEEYGGRDPVSAVAAKGLGAGLVGTPRQIADRLRYLESIGIDSARWCISTR